MALSSHFRPAAPQHQAPVHALAEYGLKSFLRYPIFLGLDAQAVGQLPPKKDAAGERRSPPDDGGPPSFVTGDDLPFFR